MIWLNGDLVPEADAQVSTLDRGLLYGDGLFETMLATSGRVFRLGAHLERLANGCAELAIELPFTPAQLVDAVYATLAATGLAEAAVRLTVTRGAGGVRLLPAEDAVPTVIIRTHPFDGYPVETYERGLRVVVADMQRNEHSVTSRLKTLDYLDNVVAHVAARAAGADDALMLNTAGQLACLTAANLFVVLGRDVYTPPPACGVLPGITRQCVLDLLSGQGTTVREESPAVTRAGLRVADRTVPWEEVSELFATNSLMGVAPVVEIEGRRIGSGRPGPVARSVREQYELMVESESQSV